MLLIKFFFKYFEIRFELYHGNGHHPSCIFPSRGIGKYLPKLNIGKIPTSNMAYTILSHDFWFKTEKINVSGRYDRTPGRRELINDNN
jgi:hypothetical protein